MKTVMLAWIGGTDHDAADDNNKNSLGPIARVSRERTDLDGIHLLNNYSTRKSAPYKKWLRATTKTKARITTREVKLDTPTDFGAIYSNVLNEIDTAMEFESLNGLPAQGGSIDSHAIAVAKGMIVTGSGYARFGQNSGNALVTLKPVSND